MTKTLYLITAHVLQSVIYSLHVIVLNRAGQLQKMLKKDIHYSGDFSHRLVSIIRQISSLMASVITVLSST